MFDNEGRWLGTCEKCGTNHEGWPPDTFGGDLRCIRARAEAAGLGHLVDQAETLQRHVGERRDAALCDAGWIL